MTEYINQFDEPLEEFNIKCNKAVEELRKLALGHSGNKNDSEFRRILSKIEGIEIARGWVNDEFKIYTGV